MDNAHPNSLLAGNNREIATDRRSNVPTDVKRRDGNYPYYPDLDIPDEPSGFDFYKYLRIFTKYRWLIVSSIFSCLALAVVITFLMKPIFRSTATIEIDRETINIIKVDGMQPNESQGGLEFYQTQYELLASRSLAERVVTALNLGDDPNFNVENASVFSNLLNLITRQPKMDAVSNIPIEARVFKATDKLLKMLGVAPVRGSRVVHLNIDHPDPVVSQRVANGYAEVFIASNLDRRYDANSYARKFLEDRLQQLKVKLEESEKSLTKYAGQQGIFNLDANKSLSSTDLEAINTRLATARAERIKKELLWKQAQVSTGLGLKEILENPTIQENRKQRAQLSGEYQQKLTSFKPAYPVMLELRNQIDELDRQLKLQISEIKQSINSAYVGAKNEEAQLQAMLDNSKIEVVDLQNRSIQYNILKREADTNRSLYDGLLQRYKEIGIAGGVGTNNVSIVDHAITPIFPQSPKLSINMILGALAGLIVGAMTALGLDFPDDTFRSPEDIERELGLPIMGLVPRPEAGVGIEVELEQPRSPMSEAYRSLRTGLQFSTHDGLPRNILITSSKPAEGKSTTCISLARSLASIGINVLLIDGDLRKASLHKRLKMDNSLGLSNYLASNTPPEEVVQSTDLEKLTVMTSGPLPPNPAELLSGTKFATLLMLAKESFDLVIIDGPPVMGLADAPLIGSVAQTTLMIVAAHETRRNVVKVALKRLAAAKCNPIGVVLNKFDVRQTGYGYGYGYGEYEYHSYGEESLHSLR